MLFVTSASKAIVSADPIELGKATVAGWTAVVSALDALRAEVNALVYVGCLVLSKSKNGLNPGEFRAEVDAFFARIKGKKLPWYTGLTKPYLKQAIEATKAPNWFEDMLANMRKGKWITEERGYFKFCDRHIVLKRSPAQ